MSNHDIPIKVTSCPECGHDGRKIYDQNIHGEQFWCTECGHQYQPRYEELKDWVNKHNENMS